MTWLSDKTHNSEGRIVGVTSIVGPSTRRKSTVESMFDPAQETVSGQLAKMRWGLGLKVPADVPVRRRLPASSPRAA